MKRAALHNLGCKVNAYETEAMKELLEKNGYQIVPFEEIADVYIINTCSVTNVADKKSRQMLHRAKKKNPNAVVVAAGCYVQSAGKELLQDQAVDILIGNNEKAKLPKILEEWGNGSSFCCFHDLSREKNYENLTLTSTLEHTRAYVKIQDGCDQFCSYCIIPYTRGRVRSRRLPDILEEVQRLVQNGFQEVVLTGIHLDSYGVDLEGEGLLTVLQAIDNIDGISRIRLGSLEPRIMSEEFVSGLAKIKKLCPHFHLSLQSGCDETLRRMNRKYNTSEFRECCDRLRENFDNPALTTDIIVGFPGETEEEFLKTVEFLKEIHFYETHVFKFSRRRGTRADRMDHQVTEHVKNTRSEILLNLTEKNSQSYREQLIGRTVEVLIEDFCEEEGKKYQAGYTREYVRVAIPGSQSLSNQIVQIKVEKLLNTGLLYGKLRNFVGK